MDVVKVQVHIVVESCPVEVLTGQTLPEMQPVNRDAGQAKCVTDRGAVVAGLRVVLAEIKRPLFLGLGTREHLIDAIRGRERVDCRRVIAAGLGREDAHSPVPSRVPCICKQRCDAALQEVAVVAELPKVTASPWPAPPLPKTASDSCSRPSVKLPAHAPSTKKSGCVSTKRPCTMAIVSRSG